jgi:hypothetical protein
MKFNTSVNIAILVQLLTLLISPQTSRQESTSLYTPLHSFILINIGENKAGVDSSKKTRNRFPMPMFSYTLNCSLETGPLSIALMMTQPSRAFLSLLKT